MPSWNGSPPTSATRSFTTIGTPAKGPRSSLLAAAARASSNIVWITACNAKSRDSMSAIACSTNSVARSSPPRTLAASSVASAHSITTYPSKKRPHITVAPKPGRPHAALNHDTANSRCRRPADATESRSLARRSAG